jgi:hypothetical protein
MAIVKFRRTRNKSKEKEFREETEHTEFGGTSFKSAKDIANYYFYLNKMKEYIYSSKSPYADVVDEFTRMKLIVQNVIPEELLPYNFLNLPETEYNNKLRSVAELYAEKVVEHNEYWRNMNGEKSTIEQKELIFSFAYSEMQGLNFEQVKERVHQYVDKFTSLYIGKNWNTRIPHLQIHAKPNGIVDAHLLLSYYDNEGQKIREFGSSSDLESKSNIMYELENSGQFPWIEKVITNAWIEQGKLTTPDEVPNEVKALKEILSRNPSNPEKTHRELITAGIKITGHRKGSTTGFISVNYKGKKFIVNSEFDSELNVKLNSYLEKKEFNEKNKGVKVDEITEKLITIIEQNKGKSLEELNKQLLNEGICLKLNPNKKNEIRGISFDFGNGTKIKSSRIEQFKLADFKISNTTYNNLLVENEKFNQVITDVKFNGFANHIGFAEIGEEDGATKKKRNVYAEWKMRKGESLYAFQNRMRESNNKRALFALNQFEIPSPFSNLVYHNYNGRKKLIAQMVDEKNVKIFNNNKSSIKAALQILHANNRDNGNTVNAGRKHFIEISSTNLEALNRAWLEAKLLGYEPIVKIKDSKEEFKPTISTLEEYEKEIISRRVKHRKENLENVMDYLKNPIDTRKVKIACFSNLGNEVDRSAIALAYLDAYTIGFDTDLLFNPPNTHKKSRNRLLLADLAENYNLLLATARTEIPGDFEGFKAVLDKQLGKVPVSLANEQKPPMAPPARPVVEDAQVQDKEPSKQVPEPTKPKGNTPALPEKNIIKPKK